MACFSYFQFIERCDIIADISMHYTAVETYVGMCKEYIKQMVGVVGRFGS